MKEELIIKILDKSSAFLTIDMLNSLRVVLVEQLYHINVTPEVTALVPINNTHDRISLYLASKNIDGLSRNSLESYHRHLRKLAQVIQKDLENITAMDIRMYLAAYSKSGVKNSTLSTAISVFKSFFSWMVSNDYLPKSPMSSIKTTKTEKYIRKALNPIEMEMVRDNAKSLRDKALVEFFYSTGCRLDEVQKLNRDGIDWRNGSVVVFGKGSKERVVFLNAKAMIHLQKYLKSRNDTNEALFVGERAPHVRLGRRMIQRTFSKLGQAAGITKNVYPHLLRHTTATHLLNNGASLPEVQKILGHSSPATTQIYCQLNNESIQQSHKRHLA